MADVQIQQDREPGGGSGSLGLIVVVVLLFFVAIIAWVIFGRDGTTRGDRTGIDVKIEIPSEPPAVQVVPVPAPTPEPTSPQPQPQPPSPAPEESSRPPQ